LLQTIRYFCYWTMIFVWWKKPIFYLFEVLQLAAAIWQTLASHWDFASNSQIWFIDFTRYNNKQLFLNTSTEKKQFAQQTQTQLVHSNQKIYKNQLGAMISTQENKKIRNKNFLESK
jgi:hypothetical protein